MKTVAKNCSHIDLDTQISFMPRFYHMFSDENLRALVIEPHIRDFTAKEMRLSMG